MDPDGREKIKLQVHIRFNTGIIGAGIKALGFKHHFDGATENELSININYDTDSKTLMVGAANITREKRGGDTTMGGIIGGGETAEKEFGTEVSVGFDFEMKEFITPEPGQKKEEDFRSVEEGSIVILTATDKQGESGKLSLGVNPEVNAGVVGVGLGVNLSVSEYDDPSTYLPKNIEQKEEEK